MAIDPGDGEQHARRIVPVVALFEVDALATITEALTDQRDGSGGWDAPADRWAEGKMRRVPRLRRRLAALVDRVLPSIGSAVRSALGDAWRSGATAAADDSDTPDPPPQRARVPFVVVRLDTETTRAVETAARRSAAATLTAYREAIYAGTAPTITAGATRRSSSQRVLDRLASAGDQSYRDRAGRRWSLETYSEMAVRTVTGQAALDAYTETLGARGHDLVVVSDAPRECPLCRPWEGKVLSLSGQDPPAGIEVAGTLAEARAAGLMHPNCRHRVTRHIPGVPSPVRASAEPAGYEAQQRQRALERRIRAWKRREAVALDDQAAARARNGLRDAQADLRGHLAEHTDLKRQRHREQIDRAR